VTLLRVRPRRARHGLVRPSKVKLTPDILFAGSDVGGAVMAADLAQRGLRVLVPERGPWWRPACADRPPTDRRDFPRDALGIRSLVRSMPRARRRDGATSC
jgi:cholesterol oxidase